MSDAQIDMFEVQLGAAMLMQLHDADGRAVRVLADAGVTAGGYPVTHVRDKLLPAFQKFSSDEPRLDLIIGTHYDADHLDGLVPIIEDQSIEIGEAWMPPVANDTETHAAEDSIQERHLLGYQFEQENGMERLTRYLNAKQELCEELYDLEVPVGEIAELVARPQRNRPRVRWADGREAFQSRQQLGDLLDYFQMHVSDANEALGDAGSEGHADEDVLDSLDLEGVDEIIQSMRFYRRGYFWVEGNTRRDRLERAQEYWRTNPAAMAAQVKNLAFLRRSSAKDAINAISLAKVVSALRKRGVPISYRMIKDGKPRRFVWRNKSRQFEPGDRLKSDGPELLLLGPSEELVKKHWDRLPIGDYMAAFAMSAIPIKSITPSNQLSYVARLASDGQGILISGDAGFVDFKPRHGGYYAQLLQSLLPLHVIQVAHHGGNNAHFYRVLLEAGYAEQEDKSYLLLSHATEDKYRPSKEFGMFIEAVRKEGDDLRLLFTSRPESSKVRDYKEIINPPVGGIADVGDIRLSLDQAGWVVKAHAIHV